MKSITKIKRILMIQSIHFLIAVDLEK